MGNAARKRMQKRVLIVNCYFDPLRLSVRRKFKIPHSMTPAYLAGIFSSDHCRIKLYNEMYSGPLEDETLLAFPDMLVLTGLNVAFDRMLHITAYVKTKNPKAIVVAGGPAIRALYHYAQNFFDHCCTGDIEQLAEIVAHEFGEDYLADIYRGRGWAMPRSDLAYWAKLITYAESSRNCYFNCHYCSLTGEKGCYQTYELDYLQKQITEAGRQQLLHFLDNNFASNNRRFTLQRFELIKNLHRRGYIKRWAAEVTCDFFFEDDNLKLALESGCGALFCGIESFDNQALSQYRKKQNTHMPQVELIQKCLRANIPFHYGIVFDFTHRTIDELARELDFIMGTPEIPLPSFITLAIPLLKTPLFYECLEQRLFLPNLRLRDLDGATITLQPRNKLSEAVAFLVRLQKLSGYKMKILQHIKQFCRIYKNDLTIANRVLAQYSAFLLCAPKLSTLELSSNHVGLNPFKRPQRAFIGSYDRLDPAYQPAFAIDPHYRHYFKPTRLTDREGNICESLLPDIYAGH